MELIGQDKISKVMPHSHNAVTTSVPIVNAISDIALNNTFSNFNQTEDIAFVRKVGENVLTTLVGEFLNTLKAVKNPPTPDIKTTAADTALKLIADLAPTLVQLFKPQPLTAGQVQVNPYSPANIALMGATQDMMSKQALTQQRIMSQERLLEQKKLQTEEELNILQQQRVDLDNEFKYKFDLKMNELKQLQAQILNQVHNSTNEQVNQPESISGTNIINNEPVVNTNTSNGILVPKEKLSELEEYLDMRESSARIKSARSMLLEVYYLGIERGKVKL